MSKGLFNFRHVMMRLGIPSTNDNNWGLGQRISRIAAKHGVQTYRILTEKTDPNPSVDAPHCICHYEMSIFDLVCEEVRGDYVDQARQLSLFDD